MSDIRERLTEVIEDHILDEGANECSCEGWEHWEDPYPERIAAYSGHVADAILAAGWTPPRERTAGEDLALIRQTIREIKAEALREAASAAVTEGEGIPWNHDHDRATVSAWLEGRADYIEKEAEHG